MGRLVLKTAAITLASVIGVAALVFCAFVLFSPVTLARLSDNLNFYSAAVFFYEKQYSKTDSAEDLSALISVLDENSDSGRLAEYSRVMLEREDFSDYCADAGAKVYGGRLQAEEYFYGRFAVSGDVDDVVEFCVRFVRLNGYTDYNPFRILISERGEGLGDADIRTVLDALKDLKPSLSDTTVIDVDINYLKTLSDEI